MGTVVEATTRRPVAGAKVFVRPLGEDDSDETLAVRSSEEVPGAITDGGGRFAIDVDAVGEITACVLGGGWCSKGLGTTRPDGAGTAIVEMAAGGEATVVLEVEHAARVMGTVFDADGRPAPDTSVLATARSRVAGDRGDEARAVSLSVVSSADGRFVLDTVMPGVDAEVYARVGRGMSASVALGALEPGSERSIELRIARVRTIVVTVVGDPGGKPIAGADVFVVNGGNKEHVGQTDTSGKVTIPDSPVVALKVLARKRSTGSGVFIESDGEAEVPAAADGAAAVPETSVTIRIGADSEGADAPRRTIAGIVRFPDGVPAAGATVAVESSHGNRYAAFVRRVGGGHEWRSALTADVEVDGSFHLEIDDRESAEVTASISRLGAEWTAEANAPRGAKSIALTLREGDDDTNRLRIRVLDADGKPVASARTHVSVTDGADGSETSPTVEDGWLQIGAAPTAIVVAEVFDARGADGARLPLGLAKFGPVTAEKAPAELRLPPECVIDGIVTAADGTPIARVAMHAKSAPGGDGAASPGESVSDAHSAADGTFRLRGLDEREYLLTPTTPLGYIDEADRDLRAHGAAPGANRVVVVLRPGREFVVHIIGADGSPIVGAFVKPTRLAGVGADPASAEAEPRPRWSHGRQNAPDGAMTTDGAGEATLAGIDPEATYALEVIPPEKRSDVRSRRIGAWKPANDTIRLDPPLATRGIVRTPAGERIAAVMIGWKLGDTDEAVRSGPDGSFVIENSEPGEISLEATFGNDADSPTATARVAAGSQDVVLVLDGGGDISVRFDPAEPAPDQVNLAREGDPPVLQVSTPDDVRNGVYRFRGLRPDHTFTVWTTPRDEDPRDPVAFAAGLHPSGDVVTLRRTPGRSLTVHVTGTEGVRSARVNVRRGAMRLSQWTGEGGTIGDVRFEGIPDGRCQIEVQSRPVGSLVVYAGSAAADAGGEVEVRLEPVKK